MQRPGFSIRIYRGIHLSLQHLYDCAATAGMSFVDSQPVTTPPASIWPLIVSHHPKKKEDENPSHVMKIA